MLGCMSETKRWGEPHKECVFALVHVVLSEPRVKKRALVSGLYVDTSNQPLRNSAYKDRMIQHCVALLPTH